MSLLHDRLLAIRTALRPHGYALHKGGSNNMWLITRTEPRRKFKVFPKSMKWLEMDVSFMPGDPGRWPTKSLLGKGEGLESLVAKATA